MEEGEGRGTRVGWRGVEGYEAGTRRIRGMREFGILDYLYRQGVANASECLKPIKADMWRSLDQGDFYGIFSIYAGGEH
ncbi:hypothetical protein Pcinc_002137 [Petrolisthes cinctipes]|uniref:Uncharacterized protein n=1 Tax=Petrolisthes cinctipes TaxID=88211 RepID=A0AAE1GJF3_PETCI|nr:hypothetical protein Pcinc_002137 [Petrolisthes cinctipes]